MADHEMIAAGGWGGGGGGVSSALRRSGDHTGQCEYNTAIGGETDIDITHILKKSSISRSA